MVCQIPKEKNPQKTNAVSEISFINERAHETHVSEVSWNPLLVELHYDDLYRYQGVDVSCFDKVCGDVEPLV